MAMGSLFEGGFFPETCVGAIRVVGIFAVEYRAHRYRRLIIEILTA